LKAPSSIPALFPSKVKANMPMTRSTTVVRQEDMAHCQPKEISLSQRIPSALLLPYYKKKARLLMKRSITVITSVSNIHSSHRIHDRSRGKEAQFCDCLKGEICSKKMHRKRTTKTCSHQSYSHGSTGSPPRTVELCIGCTQGRKVLLKCTARGLVWGCSRFPECKFCDEENVPAKGRRPTVFAASRKHAI